MAELTNKSRSTKNIERFCIFGIFSIFNKLSFFFQFKIKINKCQLRKKMTMLMDGRKVAE
jgi:predicted transglutaminase-like protease